MDVCLGQYALFMEEKMLIDKLENGSTVILEYMTENGIVEITSKVTGTGKNAVLVEPIKTMKGADKQEMKNVDETVCNLYADDQNGKRVGWYNVTVKTTDYNHHSYSGIYTHCFNQNSAPSDRRDNERFGIGDLVVRVETSDGALHDVHLHDVSNTGLAFRTEGGEDYLNKRLIVHIEDVVNNEDVKVNVHCTCVRSEEEGDRKLFGCNIGEAERSFLTYIFRKKMELRKACS